MKITKVSRATGIEHTMDLPITQAELDRCWSENPNRQGEHVQDVFPYLSPDQREFLISGTTAQEWEELFGSGDE